MRTGLVHDYTRRGGVVSTEIMLPDGTSAERNALWNAAELAEKRKDGRTGREWIIALPAELDEGQRQELASAFGIELATRYGVAVDLAIHMPDREGDNRNHHAHVMTTTRQVSRDAAGLLVMGAKSTIELSDTKRRAMGLGSGADEVTDIRQLWERMANRALEQAGSDARIDSRSLKAQGLDREATTHLGPVASDMERREKTSDRGDGNRQVAANNEQRAQLSALVLDLVAYRAARTVQKPERKQRTPVNPLPPYAQNPHRIATVADISMRGERLFGPLKEPDSSDQVKEILMDRAEYLEAFKHQVNDQPGKVPPVDQVVTPSSAPGAPGAEPTQPEKVQVSSLAAPAWSPRKPDVFPVDESMLASVPAQPDSPVIEAVVMAPVQVEAQVIKPAPVAVVSPAAVRAAIRARIADQAPVQRSALPEATTHAPVEPVAPAPMTTSAMRRELLDLMFEVRGSSRVDTDASVMSAMAEVSRFTGELKTVERQNLDAERQIAEWRKSNPLRAKLHDSGVSKNSTILQGASYLQDGRERQAALMIKIDQATARGEGARKQAQQRIELQRPIKARIAELERALGTENLTGSAAIRARIADLTPVERPAMTARERIEATFSGLWSSGGKSAEKAPSAPVEAVPMSDVAKTVQYPVMKPAQPVETVVDVDQVKPVIEQPVIHRPVIEMDDDEPGMD